MEDEARRIIASLAQDRRVEQLVCNIAHTGELGADLQDLCQMVYVFLLEYKAERIIDLWENGDMDFFLARVIVNNLRSKTSRFHYIFRKYREQCVDINGMDFLEDVSVPTGVRLNGGGIPDYESTRWKNKSGK